jgi:putative membrane protein
MRARVNDRGVRTAWKGAVAGLAGGLLGAWVMNQFQAGLSKLSRHQERAEGQKPSQSEEGDDATVKAASAISQTLLHHQLTSDEKRVAGPVVHYAFGSLVGGLYGAMAEVVPVTAKAWGVPFGAAVWLGADEVGVPAAGLSQSPEKAPVTTHASALAAHLVYGATADGVRRLVRWALIGRTPNGSR